MWVLLARHLLSSDRPSLHDPFPYLGALGKAIMDDGMAFLVSLRATNIGLKATNIDRFFGVGRHVGAC